MPEGHSKIGASSAHRWFECPGSVRLCATVIPTTSEFAEEGTAAHELAEHCLKMGVPAVSLLDVEFNGFKVTVEMAEAVQVYLDFIEENYDDSKILQVEKKFHLDWLHPDLYGTNDACIDEPFGRLTIVDYKHGKGVPVEVEENKQLMYYALGALHDAPGCEEVELVIVQPRAAHVAGPVRRWLTTPERLRAYQDELREAVIRTEAKEAALSAGKHCRFCDAAPICPELKRASFELVGAEEDLDKSIVLPEPEALTDEDIVRVLEGKSMMESWLKAVAGYAQLIAEKRGLPGYKLVEKMGHRRWKSEDDVRKLEDKYGEEIYAPRKLKTPAQLEKVVDKELVSELCEVPVTGNVLAPESDKRRAINPPSAAEDFIISK